MTPNRHDNAAADYSKSMLQVLWDKAIMVCPWNWTCYYLALTLGLGDVPKHADQDAEIIVGRSYIPTLKLVHHPNVPQDISPRFETMFEIV